MIPAQYGLLKTSPAFSKMSDAHAFWLRDSLNKAWIVQGNYRVNGIHRESFLLYFPALSYNLYSQCSSRIMWLIVETWAFCKARL
jgi:hypothetical protein